MLAKKKKDYCAYVLKWLRVERKDVGGTGGGSPGE